MLLDYQNISLFSVILLSLYFGQYNRTLDTKALTEICANKRTFLLTSNGAIM